MKTGETQSTENLYTVYVSLCQVALRAKNPEFETRSRFLIFHNNLYLLYIYFNTKEIMFIKKIFYGGNTLTLLEKNRII